MNDATTGRMADSFGRSGRGKKKSLFGKFNVKVQDAIQQGRGEEAVRQSVAPPASAAAAPADDVALRSAQAVVLQRMIVPEGVVIEGAMTSSSDTQVAGRVDGDVTVEARLILDPSAVIKGSVHATACMVQGHIEGTIESVRELVVGETGRVDADAIAGKEMTVAGHVDGNIRCGGTLRLMGSARVTGNIRARALVIDEGATFNGKCSVAKPKAKKGDSSEQKSGALQPQQVKG